MGTRRASEILPSATKILQPKDNYLISFDHFMAASPDFVAKSDYLYNGKQLLEQYVLRLFYSSIILMGLAIGDCTSPKFSLEVNNHSTGMFRKETTPAGKKGRFSSKLLGRRRAYLMSIISSKGFSHTHSSLR